MFHVKRSAGVCGLIHSNLFYCLFGSQQVCLIYQDQILWRKLYVWAKSQSKLGQTCKMQLRMNLHCTRAAMENPFPEYLNGNVLIDMHLCHSPASPKSTIKLSKSCLANKYFPDNKNLTFFYLFLQL